MCVCVFIFVHVPPSISEVNTLYTIYVVLF